MAPTSCIARPARRCGLPALAAVALAIAAGCEAPPPERPADPAGAPGRDSASALASARYLTHLLFVAGDGTAFHGAFDQTADERRLTRTYEGWWLRNGSWERLLEQRDSLPVPRAGWRVLPTANMSVRVGDAGELVGLRFSDAGDGDVRLEAGEELAVWIGPTGQRESLGVGVLTGPDEPVPGLLFFRRAARALRIAEQPGATRHFLLADSLGNGLLLQAGPPPEPSVAHTWLHGVEGTWTDLALEAEAAEERAWRFELPGTDLEGRIRATGETAPGVPAFAVAGTLTVGEQSFRFVGLSTEIPPP